MRVAGLGSIHPRAHTHSNLQVPIPMPVPKKAEFYPTGSGYFLQVSIGSGSNCHPYDCALFQKNVITGYGFCFRDSLGHLVSGVSNFIHQLSLPTEAEALDLYEAIMFAIAQNMSSVIFESD